MNVKEIAQAIQEGSVSLGIELGSTRIKAVLITNDFKTIASGSYQWENQFENDVWTYALDQVWEGVRESYKQLAAEVESKYHTPLKKVDNIGISAMMHGYLAFSKDDELLVPFRTWRNNITGPATDQLTELFGFNIPQRWCIAHLYQAILNQEEHVENLDFLTTLSGYVHWQLTGKKVLGIGDASGAFPIDETQGDYNERFMEAFSQLEEVQKYSWDLHDVFPKVLKAGEDAGKLTDKGAKLLDPSGNLQGGSRMAPPEGDAGTGMIATNSIRKRTGNISVGTSAFAMVVLDRPLQKLHREIDIVTTPAGTNVAMVHTDNCSSDIDAWAQIFQQFAERLGIQLSPEKLYETLFLDASKSDPDAGGLINYSYLSGEVITEVADGRPMFVRTINSEFNLANFVQSQLYGAFAPLAIGMDTLTEEEQIKLDVMIAHGGLFKTPVIAQQNLANALDIPISVMETAGEGGPWGMAVLAEYMTKAEEVTLEDFLDQEVFESPETMTLNPEPAGVKGYAKYLAQYQAALPAERIAGEKLKERRDT
ncbi:L-ribulokinase [Tetragenococcus halophilus subsp. flandriensis]|uniref:xylulokinase n=1 Tax=Tetragenococcus halophilus TaxID=51669 RepID=UPI0023E999BE|nr:FGGY-family carbohydrate kinase [Tetragenococcus halophilus]GMA08036.1 L-ribulokinase [Tetragenococcus halophilus subsp. flandriensis]